MSTIELKTPVPIKVSGHPAKIVFLAPDHYHGGVSTYIELDAPVEGRAGFTIVVPVVVLESLHALLPDAFIAAVRSRAENEFADMMRRNAEDRAKQEERKERGDRLQAVVHEVVDLLGGAKERLP